MNLNFPSKSYKYFPLRSLPDVVVWHIAQFLTPSDLGNMRRVNQHFRQVFSSPHLWKGIKICMPREEAKCHKKKIDLQVLETIKLRRITELEIRRHDFSDDMKVILQSLPQLERLSIDIVTPPMLRALEWAASSRHLNLKKLGLGNVRVDIRSYDLQILKPYHYTSLLQQLPRLEEISLGCCIGQMGSELPRSLCCSGKLTSVSLSHFVIKLSCLTAMRTANPHLKTLSLASIQAVVEGVASLDVVVDSSGCSSLTSLDLLKCSEEVPEKIFSWAFPGTKPNRNLTSLKVTGNSFKPVFPLIFKLPALRRLNLTDLGTPKWYIFECCCNLKSLEWLKLDECQKIRGGDLLELCQSVGKTLQHLIVPGLWNVTDAHLRDLERLLPVLRTLDLSGCMQISDAILVEWYIKDGEKRWPKLRRLVLKGCARITQKVVDSVRLKTRNQLLIEFSGNISLLKPGLSLGSRLL